MGTVAPIVGSLGFVALLVGVLMFLPLRKLKPRRPLAKKLAIGGGVAFILGLSFTPTPPSSTPTTPTQAASKPAAPSKAASPSAVPSRPAAPSQDSSGSVLAVTRATMMSVVFCSGEVDQMQRAIDKASAGSGTPMQAYSAASYAERDCRKMVTENGERDSSPFKSAALNSVFKGARAACDAVPHLGVEAASIAQKVLDEDASMKTAQRYIDKRNAITGKLAECKMNLQGVAEKGGVPKSEVDFLQL